MEERDLVLLEEVQDAVVVLLHHAVLAGDHLGHVHAHVLDLDAMVGEVVVGLVEMLGRLQQRLGGNAAHVGAGAARCGAALAVLPLVDAGHVKAQLRGTDGSDVAAGAAADHDHVELFAHVNLTQSVEERPTGGRGQRPGHAGGSIQGDQMSNSRREGSSSASFMATKPSTASRPSMMRWSYDMAR